MAVKVDFATARDLPDVEVRRIRQHIGPFRIGTTGMREVPGRRRLSQRFVRTLVVVDMAEHVKALLLGAPIAFRRPRGFSLQLAVHPLVRTVLVGTPRRVQHRLHPEFHQADAHATNPAERVGAGKRHPVVTLHRLRHPILAKNPYEHGPDPGHGGGAERLTREQIPTEALHHRERIAVVAIARAKLPLKSTVITSPTARGSKTRRNGAAVARRRGRASTRPWRCRMSPIVDGCGHDVVGSTSHNRAYNFLGPHPYRRRAATTRATTSSGVWCGQVFATGGRSSKPARPASRYRRVQAYSVVRVVSNRAATSAPV